MSSFRPGGARSGPGAHIGYSPLCVPRVINGVKCVIVSEALKDVDVRAWDFVMNFARDNELQVAEACLLPDKPPAPAAAAPQGGGAKGAQATAKSADQAAEVK
jgi:hypothetical protein